MKSITYGFLKWGKYVQDYVALEKTFATIIVLNVDEYYISMPKGLTNTLSISNMYIKFPCHNVSYRTTETAFLPNSICVFNRSETAIIYFPYPKVIMVKFYILYSK